MVAIQRLHRTLILGALALTATVAHADLPLHLVGSTTGLFHYTSVAGHGNGNPGGLTYTGGSFDTYTALDPVTGQWAYSLGSADVADNSLGIFSLKNKAGTYSGTFSLTVNFTAPTATSAIFASTLTGTISSNGGRVSVNFDNTPKSFSFVQPNGKPGTFTLGVEDLSIGRPRTGTNIVALSGDGVGSIQSVPGPGSLATFGVGLAFRASARRRRAAKK